MLFEDEYGDIMTVDDLMKYLWKPYNDLGGNGTAEKAISEVEHLELRERNG